jgi:hypothetical protein
LKEEQLIFIVSQPRAGSTYLQNLLSNNKEVNTCSEPWILLNFANQIKPELVETKFENDLGNQAFHLYKKKYKNFDFEQKQKEYLLSLYSPMIEGFNFVVDKTPRYWEIIDEIALLFPKSKIIVLKRNPLDVIKSMVHTWDLNTIEKLSVFKRDILLAPRKLQEFCVSQKNNLNVLEVSYESLINKTNNEGEKIYNWLGVAYNKDVLDISKNTKYKGVFGDPYQNQFKVQNIVTKKGGNPSLNKYFSAFLNGYTHFLGVDFLKSYGDYNIVVSEKKMNSFKKFQNYKNVMEKDFNKWNWHYINGLFSRRKFN